jgi:hypothetical protein
VKTGMIKDALFVVDYGSLLMVNADVYVNSERKLRRWSALSLEKERCMM